MDVPKKLIDDCNKRHGHYTVGFVRVERSERTVDAILLGSGVLVKVGDVCAILTADHVLDILPQSGRLGLILSDTAEQTTIEVSGINYLSISRGEDEERGPDIGAVLLSHPVAAALEARKTFYNLNRLEKRMLSNPPDDQVGIWAVQGFVEQLTVLEPNPSPFERLKAFCQFGVFGGVKEYVSIGDHDYYTFPLYESPSDDIPSNFGGCSGGGLWHVILKETEEGELAVGEILLQGLTYFQYPPHQGSSALRCHGPRSIYGVAFSAIGQQMP